MKAPQPKLHRPAFAALLGLSFCGSVPAQTPPAAAPTGDGIVILSPFEVSAEAQTGYTASESATGSRIPTAVKDLPYNVDIITSDFMNDFALFDFSQTLQGGMVTQDMDAGSSYTVRGISASGQLYDGFWMPAGAGNPVPSAFRARTEILDGPSAGIYGQTEPGGMINIVPIKPSFAPSEQARVSFGSYALFDGRLKVTGPLSRKTAFLVALDDYQRGFDQPWHENRTRSAMLSFLHDFDPSSSLRVDLTTSIQRNTSPSNRVPYYFNSATNYYYGIAYPLMDLSGTGPNSCKNTDNYGLFSVYEKRLNDVFSLRIGAESYAINLRSFNTTDVTSYDPDPTHVGSSPFGTPFFGLTRLRSASSSFSAPSYQKNYQDGGGGSADLLADTWLFNHKVENKSLFTLEYHTYYQHIVKIGMPQTVKTNSKGQPTLSGSGAPSVNNANDPSIFPIAPAASDPSNYWLPIFNPLGPQYYTDPSSGLPVWVYNLPTIASGLYQIKSWQKTRQDTFGAMYRDQATLWNRLHLFGDLRFDNVMYNVFVKQYPNFSTTTYPGLASYVAAAYPGDGAAHAGYQGSITHYHADAFTGSAGASYPLPMGVSPYVNYSTSFNPSAQTVTGATTGAYLLPNETAQAFDYGFKGSLLQERLTFTTGGFYIWQQHVSVTANDANGIAIKQAVGEVVSRGADLSANFFATPDLAFNAAYYYTDARWRQTGNDLDMAGRPRADVPPDLVVATAKYTFGGPLRGLSTFWNFTYTGRTHAEERGNVTPSGTKLTPVGSNNGLREILIPASRIVNAGLAYAFTSRVFGRTWRQTLQFNVGNLTNHTYVNFSRAPGDRRSFTFSYTVAH